MPHGHELPDHFLRTRISPMFIPWDPARGDVAQLEHVIGERAQKYRADYAEYYHACADKASPALRDANPSVVVVPGLGLFGFGKDKREARITSEFFVNAIHVMAGANALDDESGSGGTLPQVRRPEQAKDFKSFQNYVALPRTEAFRIEYWALEEAKLQRMPAEKEFSRKVVVVVGGGSGIGREVAVQIARRGGHVVIADTNMAGAEETKAEAVKASSAEMVMTAPMDLTARDTMAAGLRAAVRQFGGFDVVINTAAWYPTPDPVGSGRRRSGRATLQINLTSNFVLAQEAARVLKEQNLPASIVLTSSANAVVPKAGSEAVRREQDRDQSPDSRARYRPRSAGAGERHCAGDRDRRVVDVPARPRHRRAQEIQPGVQPSPSPPTNCGTSWRSSTRGERSRGGRSCRSTMPTRSAGSPASRVRRRPGTSSRSTAGCRRRSCDEDVHVRRARHDATRATCSR